MKARTLLLVATAGLLTGQVRAEDAPVKEVEKLLHTLNEAFVKNDADTIKRLVADDKIAILGDGTRHTKAEQLKSMNDLVFKDYKTSDVKATVISKDVILFTFRANIKVSFKGKELPEKYMAASEWVKRDGKWQEVFYQETPLPQK